MELLHRGMREMSLRKTIELAVWLVVLVWLPVVISYTFGGKLGFSELIRNYIINPLLH